MDKFHFRTKSYPRPRRAPPRAGYLYKIFRIRVRVAFIIHKKKGDFFAFFFCFFFCFFFDWRWRGLQKASLFTKRFVACTWYSQSGPAR